MAKLNEKTLCRSVFKGILPILSAHGFCLKTKKIARLNLIDALMCPKTLLKKLKNQIKIKKSYPIWLSQF